MFIIYFSVREDLYLNSCPWLKREHKAQLSVFSCSVETINDGNFHIVELLALDQSLSLSVDGGSPKVITNLSKQSTLNFDSPLYVGGKPSSQGSPQPVKASLEEFWDYDPWCCGEQLPKSPMHSCQGPRIVAPTHIGGVEDINQYCFCVCHIPGRLRLLSFILIVDMVFRKRDLFKQWRQW